MILPVDYCKGFNIALSPNMSNWWNSQTSRTIRIYVSYILLFQALYCIITPLRYRQNKKKPKKISSWWWQGVNLSGWNHWTEYLHFPPLKENCVFLGRIHYILHVGAENIPKKDLSFKGESRAFTSTLFSATRSGVQRDWQHTICCCICSVSLRFCIFRSLFATFSRSDLNSRR